MISKRSKIFFSVLVFSFVCLAFWFTVINYNNYKFNCVVHEQDLNQLEGDLKIQILPRGGSADYWNLIIPPEYIDYFQYDTMLGLTYDAKIENKTKYAISEWKLQLDMGSNVYFNSGWCGKFEFIQHLGKETRTQVLDLRRIVDEPEEITLNHVKPGQNLLIPVHKGDRLIYHPDPLVNEYPIQKVNSNLGPASITIGFIIYKPHDSPMPNFSSGKIIYSLKSDIRDTSSFKAISVLGFIWIVFAITTCVSELRLLQMEKVRMRDKNMIQQILDLINEFIDAKDDYTSGHSQRVGFYARLIAQELKFSEDECDRIFYSALLHDVGKIVIPDSILSKKGRLTDEEFNEIKKHTSEGYRILKRVSSLEEASVVAGYHHERYDGKGYPEHLKGEEIPLYARITCVADSFDAMNSDRCYRNRFDKAYIIDQLESCSGTQFDPQIVKVFLNVINKNLIPDF